MQIEWPRAVPVAAFKTIDNINITLFTLVNDDKKK
jgi:hypothetical protein